MLRPHLPPGARPTLAPAQTKKFIKELDTGNEFTHMRIRTKKNETLVYPEKDYLLVVTQDAKACVL